MKCKLKEVCRPKQWKTISTELLGDEGYPVYGANGVIGYYKEYNHREATLLVTCRGATCGSLNICEPYSYVNGNAMALDDLREDVDIKYLYYFLKYRGFDDVISGSAQPQIIRSAIEQIEIEIKTDIEQEKIVNTLEKLEKIVEGRKQEIIHLNNLIKSRFVEMFGDPIANDKCWNTVELNSVCNGIGDGLHGTPEYDETGEYPFINGNNLMNGVIEITQATKMVNEDTYKKHFIELSDNAILLSINGTLGKLALYNGEEVMLGKSACYCNLKPEINRDFVYGVMKTDAFAGFLESNATASTIKNVGLKAIRGFNLILPPKELQKEFVTFANQVDKLKFWNTKIINTQYTKG